MLLREGSRQPAIVAERGPCGAVRGNPARRKNSFRGKSIPAGTQKMMAKLPIDDPEYFSSRAEEPRAMAEATIDAETKRMMLSVAMTYEKLAQRAEARLKGEKLD